MGVEQGRGWNHRDLVIAVGVIVGLVFVLIELTGSDIDKQASQTLGTALARLSAASARSRSACSRSPPRDRQAATHPNVDGPFTPMFGAFCGPPTLELTLAEHDLGVVARRLGDRAAEGALGRRGRPGGSVAA